MRSLVVVYCQSSARRAALRAACALLGLEPQRIVFPIATRWWSEVHMLQRAVRLLTAVKIVDTAAFTAFGDAAIATDAANIATLRKHKEMLESAVLPTASTCEAWQVRLSSSTEPTAHLVPRAVTECLYAAGVAVRSRCVAKSPQKASLEALAIQIGRIVDRHQPVPPCTTSSGSW